MKRKHNNPEDQDSAVKTKWFTLSFKGVICLLILAFMVGIFTILVFNVGYDSKNKWYWKPNNLEVHIKKSKE